MKDVIFDDFISKFCMGDTVDGMVNFYPISSKLQVSDFCMKKGICINFKLDWLKIKDILLIQNIRFDGNKPIYCILIFWKQNHFLLLHTIHTALLMSCRNSCSSSLNITILSTYLNCRCEKTLLNRTHTLIIIMIVIDSCIIIKNTK